MSYINFSKLNGYQNNPNLPKATYKHAFTQHELDEYKKCKDDPVYFAENYIKIVALGKGLVTFPIWDFQKNMIKTFHENRFTVCKLPRQVGKTTTSVAFLLHYSLFNEYSRTAILANKGSTAREIFYRLQLAFEHLPRFLQQGVVEWNKGSLEFGNGSIIIADSTSGSSVRGKSFDIIFLDEFAHVPNNIATKFFDSTYPTISSGDKTKVIIVSTPLGFNHFHSIWEKAVNKQSSYIPISINWNDVPGRDEKWKQETIANTSEKQFQQEFCTTFLGSTNTLISDSKLAALRFLPPLQIEDNGNFLIYDKPHPKKTYALTVDVSEGQGLDYSTITVFDITELPYRQVATYRNNEIEPMLLPAVIYTIANRYNEAFVLVEVNSIGLQVANILHDDLNYENLIKVQSDGKRGQTVSSWGSGKVQLGLKMSAQTKRIGCSNLKALIENDKLLLCDEYTILELRSFSANKNSFAAEEGSNDDMVMTLVHFAWLADQGYFKQSVNSDVRQSIQKDQLDLLDNDLVPFGIIDNGLDESSFLNEMGDTEIWETVTDPFFDRSLI